MAEWLKAHVWSTCEVFLAWVRIPLSPPTFKIRVLDDYYFALVSPGFGFGKNNKSDCRNFAKIAEAFGVSIEDLIN